MKLITDPSAFANTTEFPDGIIDSQIHLFRTTTLEGGLAAMNALGIQGAVIDEYWIVEEDGQQIVPGYRMPNGAVRVTPSQAMHASTRYPDRLRYLVRTDHRDPAPRHWIQAIADSPYACATRFVVRSEIEIRDFAAGGYAPCATTPMRSQIHTARGTWNSCVAMMSDPAPNWSLARLQLEYVSTPSGSSTIASAGTPMSSATLRITVGSPNPEESSPSPLMMM